MVVTASNQVAASGAPHRAGPERGVACLFRAVAARYPQAVALRQAGASLTYAELDARAEHLAQHLRARGVGKGDIVAIALARSFEMVAGLLAVLKSGAAYLPFDPGLPPQRVAAQLEDARVELVLVDGAARARLGPARWTLVEVGAALRADTPAVPRAAAAPAGGEDLAYVNYTSGSSGAPKGVMIPHRGVTSLLLEPSYARLGPGRSVLQLAPPSFDAMTFELWGPLLHGGTCVLFDGKLPTLGALARTLQANRVTTLFLTTALFNAAIDEAPSALAEVEELLTGGEAHSPAHMRRARRLLAQTRISSVYGPTEATTFATQFPIDRLDETAASVPLGTAINNRQVLVVDASGRRCGPGAPGEIVIAGPGLALGYLNRPEETSARFVTGLACLPAGERAYRTGDRARYLEGGVIEFLGRADDQVKINGYRVELGEIETNLIALDGVDRACVLLDESRGEKRLVAALVAPASAVPRARRALAQRLPAYMRPSCYLTLDALPLTANGKVDRAAVLSLALAWEQGGR